jgi:hypothetical protein
MATSAILRVEFDQSAHSQDLLLPRPFICVVHHQSHFVLAINLTNANQALLRHARSQAERAKVAHVDTATRKRLRESCHRPKANPVATSDSDFAGLSAAVCVRSDFL